MTADQVLRTLLEANVAAGAAVVVVLTARRAVRARFGPGAAYALWLAAPAAALASVLPARIAQMKDGVVGGTVEIAGELIRGAGPAPGEGAAGLATVLIALWLAGVAAWAGLAVWRSWRVAADANVGPALVGVIRPRLVLPADFETRFDRDERRLILAHEAIHAEARHPAVNGLIEAARCVSWFNPLAHVAAFYARVDQELACDAAVLERYPAERRTYAQALLKTQLSPGFLPLGCQWPGRSKPLLTERLQMLARSETHPSRRLAGAAAVALLSSGMAFAAWAAQPPRPAPDARGLSPAEAQKGAKPGQEVVCRPDANRELHDCKAVPTPWVRVATAADVAREYPVEARKAGVTADVLLACGVDRTSGALTGCSAKKVYAEGPGARFRGDFERAAIRVASVYRALNAGKAMPSPMYMTIQFRPNPAMPGGPVIGKGPTRMPAEIPMPKLSPQKIRNEAIQRGDVDVDAAPTVTQPSWIERPTAADIARLYPAQAARQGLAARVAMTCRFGADGRLANCGIAKSELEGAGAPRPKMEMDFGTATLQLAKLFRAAPNGRDGAPVVGGIVRIPVRWAPLTTPAS